MAKGEKLVTTLSVFQCQTHIIHNNCVVINHQNQIWGLDASNLPFLVITQPRVCAYKKKTEVFNQ